MTRTGYRPRPRSMKLLRDLRGFAGRVTLMVVAVAVALTGVGAMLVARTVVMREATRVYAATDPASATLDVTDGVDAELLARIRARPGVLDATARRTIVTQARVGDAWRRTLLFVVPADDPLRISRFRVTGGLWPAPDGTALVERAALPVLGTSPGDVLEVTAADGGSVALRVGGTVYDPALAPAGQERTGYLYVTTATASRLGYAPVPDQLKIVVGDRTSGRANRDPARVDAVATDLAGWLESSGHAVHGIDAPPYRHPHQNQTNTITGLFLGFALAALMLAGVLVATTLGGMLAEQTRQIGVMKTLGATDGQLLRLYVTATTVLAAVATVLAVGPATAAGQALVGVVTGLLNIDPTSRAVPAWVFAAMGAAGITIPLAVSLVVLIRATRMTVRTALDDHGADSRAGSRRSDRWIARMRLGGRTTALALRNLLRRRTRLALTLVLLSAGGSLFMTGLNTAEAWQAWVDQGLSRRAYTAELHLARPAPAAALHAVLAGQPDLALAEPVRSLPATPVAEGGQVEVSRTYPDGGHGRFVLTALDPDTRAVAFDVRRGRWLRTGDTGAAVLNQAAAARLGDPGIGDDIRVSVDGVLSRWRVVGLIDEVGGPATVYTSAQGADAGLATAIRIRTTGDPAAGAERVATALAAAGLRIDGTMLTDELRSAVDEHVMIFVYTLVALAGLMAVVGVLGLASAMTISVTERTREYGIMASLGAAPSAIRRVVLAEGVATGTLGCSLAVLPSLPISRAVEQFVGTLTFGLPLPFTVSLAGIAEWSLLGVVGAGTATYAAAARAARLTVRDSLAYQ